MINQPKGKTMKDLDMSDVNDNARDMLEEELIDLDLPMVDIAVILATVGDALDIDPLIVVRSTMPHEVGEVPSITDLKTAHGDREVQVMIDLLDEALESSTQLPSILRALEIYEGLAQL